MSVMWNRIYGKEKFANLYDRYFACQQLKMTLELTGCKRLVIGHTPQARCADARPQDAGCPMSRSRMCPQCTSAVTCDVLAHERSSSSMVVSVAAFARDCP